MTTRTMFECDSDGSTLEEIRASIGRTLWVTAWADYEENENNSEAIYSGCELFDVAPKTPEEVWETVDAFITAFEASNSPLVASFYKFCAEGWAARFARLEMTPDRFGHYLVMEAQGQGVGLWEWYDHKLKIPSLESAEVYFDEVKERPVFFCGGAF